MNDQDPFWASPTMEAPIAWRAMADTFDDGSLLLASFIVLTWMNNLASQNTSWGCMALIRYIFFVWKAMILGDISYNWSTCFRKINFVLEALFYPRNLWNISDPSSRCQDSALNWNSPSEKFQIGKPIQGSRNRNKSPSLQRTMKTSANPPR